ncbi:MAG: VanZ family protein [Deltaproteobacteria bacterium]|nr:VanZ family protein [Deltaproteobacteria bacterium]
MESCRPGRKKITLIGLYMVLLAFLSLVPMDGNAKHFSVLAAVKPKAQNLLHVPAYALLAILWMQVMTLQGRRGIGRIAPAVLAGAGFGLVMELVQVWIPGRYPSLVDGVVNLLGVFMGLLVYLRVEKRSPGGIRRLICT